MPIDLLVERTHHERNLMARINYRLRAGCRIRKTPPQVVQSLGQFHVFDNWTNRIIDWGIDDLDAYLSDMTAIQATL